MSATANDALVGYSGFVGSHLLRWRDFPHRFRSHDFSTMRDQSFDLVVFSASRSEKWRANRDPESDRAHIESLIDVLGTVKAKKFILISTIDVYATPSGQDERWVDDSEPAQPYGLHRAKLERAVRDRFTDHHVLRLPALFGEGLRKNAVYDLLHDNEVEKLDARSVYQFYDLKWLGHDLDRMVSREIRLMNAVTEPLALRDAARVILGKEFTHEGSTHPARYDLRTRFGGALGGYLRARSEVLVALEDFVREERSPR